MMRRLIAAHGYWIDRYPSLYSSANNHLIAEGLGLLIAGLLVPDLPQANKWRKSGREIIECETLKQILEDGVGAEQSPTYQAFVMEMVALAVLMLEEVGEALSKPTLDRLSQGAEYLDWLLDAGGFAPSIGDDDEGRVIAQPPDREARYVASVVAAVIGVTKRDRMPPPRDPHIRDGLFSSPLQHRVLLEGLRVFQIGGYSIVHDHISGCIVDIVFDHGPIGYLSLAAHGHADALSIWLSINGIPFFVDAGTYLYHSGGEMRSNLRETGSHNTLVLVGRSQSQITGPFMWGGKADSSLIDARPWPNWSVSAMQNGYAREFHVRHIRRIDRRENEIVVCGRLLGRDTSLPASIQFLCNPAQVVHKGNDIVVCKSGIATLEVVAPNDFEVEIAEADKGERFGWYSPGFGTIVSAPLIKLMGHISNCEISTRLRVLKSPAIASTTRSL
jgi:Heparinase II/III-like protein/Heparinase II/III N-terminus